MNVDELIVPVLDIMDRPDVQDRLLAYAPQAIRAAHSIQKFNYDITTINIPDPTILDGRVVLAPAQLPRIRDLIAISSFTDYTSAMVGFDTIYYPQNLSSDKYINQNIGYDKTDYYGFAVTSGFSRMGSNVTVTGVSSDVKMMAVTVMQWPEYTHVELSDTYHTNSWIAELSPSLIQAFLLQRGAIIAQESGMLRTAAEELQTQTTLFLREHAGEVYGG